MAKTSGDPGHTGAIGNAKWTGVALADVLAGSSVRDGAKFVGMTGADEADVDGGTAQYGASFSLAKARDRDVLMA